MSSRNNKKMKKKSRKKIEKRAKVFSKNKRQTIKQIDGGYPTAMNAANSAVPFSGFDKKTMGKDSQYYQKNEETKQNYEKKMGEFEKQKEAELQKQREFKEKFGEEMQPCDGNGCDDPPSIDAPGSKRTPVMRENFTDLVNGTVGSSIGELVEPMAYGHFNALAQTFSILIENIMKMLFKKLLECKELSDDSKVSKKKKWVLNCKERVIESEETAKARKKQEEQKDASTPAGDKEINADQTAENKKDQVGSKLIWLEKNKAKKDKYDKYDKMSTKNKNEREEKEKQKKEITSDMYNNKFTTREIDDFFTGKLNEKTFTSSEQLKVAAQQTEEKKKILQKYEREKQETDNFLKSMEGMFNEKQMAQINVLTSEDFAAIENAAIENAANSYTNSGPIDSLVKSAIENTFAENVFNKIGPDLTEEQKEMVIRYGKIKKRSDTTKKESIDNPELFNEDERNQIMKGTMTAESVDLNADTKSMSLGCQVQCMFETPMMFALNKALDKVDWNSSIVFSKPEIPCVKGIKVSTQNDTADAYDPDKELEWNVLTIYQRELESDSKASAMLYQFLSPQMMERVIRKAMEDNGGGQSMAALEDAKQQMDESLDDMLREIFERNTKKIQEGMKEDIKNYITDADSADLAKELMHVQFKDGRTGIAKLDKGASEMYNSVKNTAKQGYRQAKRGTQKLTRGVKKLGSSVSSIASNAYHGVL